MPNSLDAIGKWARFGRRQGMLVMLISVLIFSMAGEPARAEENSSLQQQVQQQQETIEQQQRLIEEQARQLEELSKRLERLEDATSVPAEPAIAEQVSEQAANAEITPSEKAAESSVTRDQVGDLRSPYLTPGEFPGSILIPGSQRDVSIAIGGFIKTLGVYDSDLESGSVVFLPGRLIPSDRDGEVFVNASLSRLTLDARGSNERGNFRAYFEHDFNSSSTFNLRHVYGAWKSGKTELLVGQTWSAMMDLQTLPEGLGEPTVSGAIFARQPQFRWTQTWGTSWETAFSIENPNANDTFDDEKRPFRAVIPDLIGRVNYRAGNRGHVQVSGVFRQAELESEFGDFPSNTGYGFQLSGHLDLFTKDRFYASAAWGEGLGRYLLGLSGTDAAVVDEHGDIQARENYGGFAGYQHYWTEMARSTLTVGYAHAVPASFQIGSEVFESSLFALGNLLWTLNPFVTLGAEYDYGQRKNEDESTWDNHRVMLGVQLF